jgi:hypothetical protein
MFTFFNTYQTLSHDEKNLKLTCSMIKFYIVLHVIKHANT